MKQFIELDAIPLSQEKHLVISKRENGEFTIAQKMITSDTSLFLKGAIHVANLRKLEDIRDMLDDVIAIQKQL